MKQDMPSKHNFLRRVIRLCLVMMVLLTLTVAGGAIIRKESIDPGSLGVLMGGWCTELLLGLLKRKFEIDDRAEEKKKADEAAQNNESEDKPGFDGPTT